MNLRASTRLVAPFAWLLTVIVVSSLSPLRSAGGALPANSPQDSEKDSERRNDDPRDREAEAPQKQDADKQGDPLAPLTRDRLPPRTRVPPDASRDQYVRDAVFVRIGEVIISSKGEEILPEVQVVDTYLQEYLRRAGFTIAASPEESRYRIEGEAFSEHYKDLKVQGQTVAYKVRADCSAAVLSREGEELEAFEIPAVYRENVKSEESAFLHLRRYVAKLLWDRLRADGGVFSDPEVTRLVTALCVTPPAAVASTPEHAVPATTEGVIARLADRGLPVVPYMLEALSDTRPVVMPSSYPGLSEENRSELTVCHIADMVLEEIFQKVSRMSLAITAKERFRIISGWEQEWRRFCPPFRDSPHAPAGNGR